MIGIPPSANTFIQAANGNWRCDAARICRYHCKIFVWRLCMCSMTSANLQLDSKFNCSFITSLRRLFRIQKSDERSLWYLIRHSKRSSWISRTSMQPFSEMFSHFSRWKFMTERWRESWNWAKCQSEFFNYACNTVSCHDQYKCISTSGLPGDWRSDAPLISWWIFHKFEFAWITGVCLFIDCYLWMQVSWKTPSKR